MPPNKVNENWELFPAKKQSLKQDKILLPINQSAVNIVSQWWIKMELKQVCSFF